MADFRDFAFKLVVVDKLMYRDKTLTPAFGIEAHMRERGVEDLDDHMEENGLDFTILDEARAYFEALEIPDELLATVDELVFDGGLKVYRECAPVWDGEDDLFDVRSLDDLDLLPNLGVVTGARSLEHMCPGAKDVLAARGITGRH
ncbi:DUF6892 domain-containing protein [Streptomyces laurentii]|uniref:DUF6892 domain-containing protein n=1 Tax=Streptomyces laurentii TaxID=39478 RepID=UPI00367B022A